MHFDKYAKDLIKRLLTLDPARRVGCLQKGSSEIKRHKWFKGFDWVALDNRIMATPMVPTTKSAESENPNQKLGDLFGFSCFFNLF